MMKTCQIMIYGGKSTWINLSHKRGPNIAWFIFIGVEPQGDTPDYWEEIGQKIEELERLQENFPESEKVKYSYIRVESENELVQLVRYFRALIKYIHKKELEVVCNLTSGVFELRIALFLASQIESDKVSEIFYFNKQNFEKNILFKSINISKKGRKLLNIIYKNIEKDNIGKEKNFSDFEYNISYLRDICEKYEYKIDLPAMSRLVSKLILEGYLNERREGRLKFISMTNIGLIYCPVFDIKKEIQNELETGSLK